MELIARAFLSNGFRDRRGVGPEGPWRVWCWSAEVGTVLDAGAHLCTLANDTCVAYVTAPSRGWLRGIRIGAAGEVAPDSVLAEFQPADAIGALEGPGSSTVTVTRGTAQFKSGRRFQYMELG